MRAPVEAGRVLQHKDIWDKLFWTVFSIVCT